MGFRYVYYDANGNGPFAIETDTADEARQLVQAGIGYDQAGQPYDPEKADDVIVDTDKGDTIGTGDAPAGVLLPGDAAYQAPEDAPADQETPVSATGSQDVVQGAGVGVQDPSVAAHDVAGSPVTPVPLTTPDTPSAAAATPAYDQTVASSGIVPSGPTPPPSDSASEDDGSSSDGSPSPQPEATAPSPSPATPDSSSEPEDGPVDPATQDVPPLGSPVTADSPADVATAFDGPTSDANDVDDDQPATAAPDAQVEDDTDDDLSSFDTPVVPAPTDDAATVPAGSVAPTA